MDRSKTPPPESMRERVFNDQAGVQQQETRGFQKSKILTELRKSPLMLKAYKTWLKNNVEDTEDTYENCVQWVDGLMNGQW